MVESSLALSLSQLVSLSARSGSWHKNLCKGSPWFQVYLGSPTAVMNQHAPLLSLELSLGVLYHRLGAGPSVASVVGS